jgi:hypothetical protein
MLDETARKKGSAHDRRIDWFLLFNLYSPCCVLPLTILLSLNLIRHTWFLMCMPRKNLSTETRRSGDCPMLAAHSPSADTPSADPPAADSPSADSPARTADTHSPAVSSPSARNARRCQSLTAKFIYIFVYDVQV